jgi:hypothetical protein
VPPSERFGGREDTVITGNQQYIRRAQLLWPGLDPTQLRRTGGDPQRIAKVVARRTTLPPESIAEMLRREGSATGNGS